MSSDETKRLTTALRVKVRYPDVETFVERFAVNVGRSGLFIPTPTPKPIGSEVRFEVRLADDRAVLIGQGLVRWIREPAPERSRATTGMAIELQRVSRASRDVLMRMLQVRKRRGWHALRFVSLAQDGKAERHHIVAPLATLAEIWPIAAEAGITPAADTIAANRACSCAAATRASARSCATGSIRSA